MCARARARSHPSGRWSSWDVSRLPARVALTGWTETVPAAALFVLAGAAPRTGWLPDGIEHDERGFIVTGPDLTGKDGSRKERRPERPPLPLETSMPGVFAVGDVRYGSVKRVSSAVGEGAVAIDQVHEYLGRI